MIDNKVFENQLNAYGKKQCPFVFAIDFWGINHMIYPLDKLPSTLAYDFDGKTSSPATQSIKPPHLQKKPLDFSVYKQRFNQVIGHIKQGNTYLLNLTAPTPIATQSTLREIFYASKSRFRWLCDGYFVSFTPERFVCSIEDRLHTYPVKGTLNASLSNAQDTLLQNPKEKAEHTMVVDLMRNDLGMIGDNVCVHDFRQIERIGTGHGALIQTQSNISVALPKTWRKHLGSILTTLLPAGSITGTPKRYTTKLIGQIERYTRGYFCGIAGIFDGKDLDTCVLIRFIEQTPKGLIYKSGGGITIDSDPMSEYKELIQKVYIPYVLL